MTVSNQQNNSLALGNVHLTANLLKSSKTLLNLY